VNNYDPPNAQVTGEPARVRTRRTLPELAADALLAARTDCGASWWASTRTGGDASPERAADRSAEDGAERGQQAPEGIVAAFASALRGARRWEDEVMRAGWGFGVLAHARRVPMHFVVEDLDLLAGMLIEVVRRRCETGRAADALRVARRLHEAASLLRLAALKGYTQAVSDDLKSRFRTLRHDLRNPLGTIKSALALMEDESVPSDTRTTARFRAMARRNASSMETLIRTTLGDSAALLPAFAHEPASLRAIACAVRRDLRAAADGRLVEIVVGDRLPTVRTDSAGFELILKSVVLAMLRDLPAPAEVVIDLAHLGEHSATVEVSAPHANGAPPLDPEELAFARELAARAGGRVIRASGRSVCVEVPISVGEQPHDVGGARERHHR